MEKLMAKTQAKVWEMASSSSSKTYQTILYTDGYVSCGCPGWTLRAVRECKHTNMVEMGTADNNCIACKDLTKGQTAPAQTVTAPKQTAVKKKKKIAVKEETAAPAVVRKINW